MVDHLYFLGTSMVFKSNASASSWEPLRRAIQALIPIFSMRDDLVAKHKALLDMLVWYDDDTLDSTMIQAVGCAINPGISNQHGPLKAFIHVEDILAAAVGKRNILRLLAAIIEAIFTVCGRAATEHRQCPLSIEKWEELVIGPVQIVL